MMYISAQGHCLNLVVTADRGGYVAVLTTNYINTTDICLELFFWPQAAASSVYRPVVSVETVTEDGKSDLRWESTGYELPTWNRAHTTLPDGIHRIQVTGHRSLTGESGMSIDDIVVQPCADFGRSIVISYAFSFTLINFFSLFLYILCYI